MDLPPRAKSSWQTWTWTHTQHLHSGVGQYTNLIYTHQAWIRGMEIYSSWYLNSYFPPTLIGDTNSHLHFISLKHACSLPVERYSLGRRPKCLYTCTIYLMYFVYVYKYMPVRLLVFFFSVKKKNLLGWWSGHRPQQENRSASWAHPKNFPFFVFLQIASFNFYFFW